MGDLGGAPLHNKPAGPSLSNACFLSNIRLMFRWLIKCKALHSNSSRPAPYWECHQKTFKTWYSWGSSVLHAATVCAGLTRISCCKRKWLFISRKPSAVRVISWPDSRRRFRRILAKAKWAIWETSAFALVRLTARIAVEIKIPVRSLARELEDQIPRASAYKDLPKGRKRAGWKKDFLRSVQKAAGDLGDISEEEILRTVREYRSGRKKLPEITVVARTKKKTA